MNDWSVWLQMLYRVPALILWILFVSAAFVLHLRRPGPVAVAQICGSILAFLALGVSIAAGFMVQREIQQSGGGGEAFHGWVRIMTTANVIQLAGALLYAFALLLTLVNLPSRDDR